MDAPWRIELLGWLRATQGERQVTRFYTQKHGALLAYLAYHPHRSHPREALIELLWPECEPKAGRNRLRVALTSLRHQIEPPGMPANSVIVAEGATLQLNPALFTTDVAAFEAALDAAAGDSTKTERLADAVELYRGELLPGYFEDWILPERQRLAEAFLGALRQLTVASERTGDLPRALQWARRAVTAEPLRDEPRHELIRLLAAAGQPEAAVRHYREWERLLAQELGTEPGHDLRALALELERRGEGETGRAGTAALSVAPSPRHPLAPSPLRLVPASLPTGTITFLLGEIAPELARQEKAAEVISGDEQAPALSSLIPRSSSLAERLCSVFRGHGGHELDSVGGRATVAFGRASDAFAAAVAGMECALRIAYSVSEGQRPDAQCAIPDTQDAIRNAPRMALHTGEVDPGEPAQASPALPHAGRLLRAAHPGQILLSERTAAMLGEELAPGLQFRDLGLFRLPDQAPAERLFQAQYEGMPQDDFPAPTARPGQTGSLPLQFSRFFGREAEIARLAEMLSPGHPARLVTLTGPGGGGKTRLALELAQRLRDRFNGSVWFVPLVDLLDPRFIPDKMLDALRLPRSPGVEPMEQAAAFLSLQPALLLLDNFEHLLPEGAPVVQTLLERVEGLAVLVSSRRRLDLPAEREFPVAPLPTPVDDSWLRVDGPTKTGISDPSTLNHQLSTLAQCDSVRLFVDRAQQSRPDFQVTAANAGAVAALCRRLEGIPLALELAAARAQVLTPAQMLERVSERFELLFTRRRRADPRHQSLRATLDWSYQLLSPELQRFFARLSVFRGGWTLAAAETVCREPQALECLAQLRESSLVIAEESGDEVRYRLLETLREYGAEQLTETERAVLARRHALCYLELAEAAEPHLRDVDQDQWLERLRREHDNLRASLVWSQADGGEKESEGVPLGPERREIGVRLAGALWWFYHYFCLWSEGREWLEKTLVAAGGYVGPAARAKALRGAGQLALHQGDLAIAKARLEESLAIWRELGDKLGCAYSLMFLGGAARRGQAAACPLEEESVALFRGLEDRWGLGQSLYFLGFKRLCSGEAEAARGHFREGLSIFRQIGDRWRIAWGLQHLGQVAHAQDDAGTARCLYREGLDLFRALDNRWSIACSLGDIGCLEFGQREYAAARECLEQSLTIWRELGNKNQIAGTLRDLAQVRVAQGDAEEARPLFHEALALGRALDDPPVIAACLEGLMACGALTGEQAIIQMPGESRPLAG